MPDWAAIRAEYIESEISLQALARRYNVPRSTAQLRKQKEKWDELREERQAEVRRKMAEKSAEMAAENVEIAARIKQKLLRKLEREIDALPDSMGSELRKNQQERIYDDSVTARGRLSKIKEQSRAYRFADLVSSYIRLTEGMITEDSSGSDDGFLSALEGSAAADWDGSDE